jgi:hypothetical protein
VLVHIVKDFRVEIYAPTSKGDALELQAGGEGAGWLGLHMGDHVIYADVRGKTTHAEAERINAIVVSRVVDLDRGLIVFELARAP